ncbi:MAG TPA: TonB-dependent receptor [Candidatus Sulfotelmatobacter sp.]|nr:TonB-dependent receptor [Candidatus Sulfotelmatobacter sp.]
MNLLRIVLACLLLTGVMFAQGVGASGDIKGTVTDPSGALVANATVTATDVDKGLKHTTASDNNGQFHLTGLQPATYNVSVSKSGFQPVIAKNVVINIGQTNTVNFPMKVSQVSEQVEVTTEPPVVETERGAQANVVNEQYIRELPINRRDYLTFTLLAPAVSDSTRLASDQDYRVKQTPQSGLSFYGSNGRGNSVTVDGGEVNDDSGGVRLNMSQDAVQEFQINRSNYGADLGGASGATINIVTKSGTNDVHGTLFGYFRNDALDAANPFSITQALAPGQTFNPANPDLRGTHTKDTLTREQFGGSIGFPLKKDKTFLYSSFEGLMGDAQNSVPLLTNTGIFRTTTGQNAIFTQLAALGTTSIPCLSTPLTVLPANVCIGALQSLLTVNPVATPSPFINAARIARDNFIVGQFENNGGLFPYTNRLYLASSRFDHQFSERNQIAVRYSFGHDREENPDVTSLTGFSRGSSVRAFDHTLLASWFHQFTPRTLNEARVQWNYANFDVVPNVPGEVGLDIPGFGNLGTQIFLPNFTIMRRYEFADNVSLIRGKHNIKFGGYELLRGNHSESHTFFPGRFVFGNLPGAVLSPCFSASATPTTANLCGIMTGGTTVNPLQSVALGLPQFYQQGFGDPTYNYPRPFTAAFIQDQWSMAPNFTLNVGVRYEIDSQHGPLATDKNNAAPRVSFAWDPFKDHKTVVRAGYGIFYSPIYGQIADVVQTLGLVNGNRQIAQTFVPLTGVPGFPPTLTSAAIFQTLFAQQKVSCTTPAAGNAACITPADLTQFGINITHTGPVPPLSVLFSGQPNYQSPYSQQAEFGIEREIANGWSVALSGIYVHTIGLPVAIDRNDLSTAPKSNITLANGAVVAVRNFNTSTSNTLTPGLAPCGGAAIINCFASPTLLQQDVYSSKGAALYEGAILEVKKRFSAHYSVLANYTLSKAFDTTTDFNSDFGPSDNTNLAAERGLSNFDQRHKIVIATIVDTGKFGGRALSGFQLSPIFRYNSGHPFNLLAGTDVNGDRHSTNDRPVGAARNTGQGPDFAAFDMRVTRRFKMGERANLQILMEGFNLFNRTNYASVNNIVGPRFDLTQGFSTFNVHGTAINAATNSIATPLVFTSAFPMRQLQFGVRVGF